MCSLLEMGKWSLKFVLAASGCWGHLTARTLLSSICFAEFTWKPMLITLIYLSAYCSLGKCCKVAVNQTLSLKTMPRATFNGNKNQGHTGDSSFKTRLLGALGFPLLS